MRSPRVSRIGSRTRQSQPATTCRRVCGSSWRPAALAHCGGWACRSRVFARDATHAVTRDVRADASIVGEPLGAALRRCTFGAAFDWARTGAARAVAADVATGATWVAGLLPDDWRPEMLSAAIGIVLSRFDAE
jgi:hypothetical protein